MNRLSRILLLCMLSLTCIALPGRQAHGQGETQLRFGVLPVLQALPLFVAAEQGYFSEAGLDVDVIPFQSAADKDIALKSGAIDGYFGDLFTPLVIEGNGLDISIVATNYSTGSTARMFGILASAKSGISTIGELEGHQIGISSASVIDYVTQQLLATAELDGEDVDLADMKNIGLRMQLLMSGELDAATLPEPLVTAAQKGGAVLLADDTGMDVSQTVLIFSQGYIDAEPEAVSAFLAAVDRANAWITDNPQGAREMMIKHTRLPEPLQQVFPVPGFPAEMGVPNEKTIAEAISWLRDAGVLRKDLTYTGLVNGDFLP